MGKVEITAIKKWNTLSKNLQEKIIDNVYCSKCTVTTVVDYDMLDDKFGVLLQGKCQKCGSDVARLVEIDV